MANTSNTYYNQDGNLVEDINPVSEPVELGFWHPDVGYWQTITAVNSKVIEAYPEGTVNVPLIPGPNFQWNGSEWVNIEPTVPVYSEEEKRAMKSAAFRFESDPLFFKWQAGEVTKQEWISKREEIRARFI